MSGIQMIDRAFSYVVVFHRHTYFAISKSDTELSLAENVLIPIILHDFAMTLLAMCRNCRNLWILVRSYHWSTKNSFSRNLLDLGSRPVLNWQPGDICVFEAGRKVWCIRWNGRKGRTYQSQQMTEISEIWDIFRCLIARICCPLSFKPWHAMVRQICCG